MLVIQYPAWLVLVLCDTDGVLCTTPGDIFQVYDNTGIVLNENQIIHHMGHHAQILLGARHDVNLVHPYTEYMWVDPNTCELDVKGLKEKMPLFNYVKSIYSKI